ncbi:RAQPRD family integrative conjugative element protein [Yersinia enterocolitica]|uniref:integrative conjugative element protein, RAQPRD family n=1 Tax=Yersinia enterocolitica TaxID=630 RepID=UPI003D7AA3B2
MDTRFHFSRFKKIAFTVALSGLLSTQAIASEVFEREQLSLILKQVKNAQRITVAAYEKITPTDTERFWFDYERLERDLKKIQLGIEHYMTPNRAQPRELHGEMASSYMRDRRELNATTSESSQ